MESSNSLDWKSIDDALSRLNSKMVYGHIDPIEVVVCGGAALIAANLVSRTTRDVDIIALAHKEGASVELLKEKRLPANVKELVAEIGAELGMDRDWLNFGPSPLLRFKLPPGFASRLKGKPYGACLTVYFIGRFDQVHFKMFAAMDPRQGERHLSDLIDLKPTVKEAKAAVDWLMTLERRPSRQFKETLRQILERIGHERIAGKI